MGNVFGTERTNGYEFVDSLDGTGNGGAESVGRVEMGSMATNVVGFNEDFGTGGHDGEVVQVVCAGGGLSMGTEYSEDSVVLLFLDLHYIAWMF